MPRWFGVFLAVCSCARAPGVQPAPASTTAPPPAPDSWEWTWLPPTDVGPAVTGTAEKFTWINGGQRVGGEGDQISVADQFPISSIVDAEEFGGGWLFLTATGALYRSDRFTGALTPVDTPAAPCRSIAGSPGAVYCVDGRFELWRAATAEVLEFTKIAADVARVRAHRDELLVADRRGFVRRLGPGGEPRGAFDTGGRCVFWWQQSGDDVWMRTDKGQLLSADGRDLSSEESPEAVDKQLWVHMKLNDQADRAVDARFAGLPVARATTRRDRSGRCLESVAGEAPLRLCLDPPPARERGSSWYDDERSEDPPVLRVERREGKEWRVLGQMVSSTEMQAAIDPKGGAVAAGRCDAAPPGRPDHSVCWWVDRAWTTVTLRGFGEGEPADAPPSLLKLYALEGPLLHGRLDGTQAVWDLGRGGERLPLPDADLVAGPWLRDGSVLTVLRGREQLVLATTTRAGTTRQTLPVGAKAAAFASSERGLAVGATVAELWTTHDGGRHWTTPKGLPTGDLSRWTIRRPTCSPTVCTAWPFTWFAPELRPTGTALTYVAEPRKLPPLPKTADLACKYAGPTSSPPDRPRRPDVKLDLATAPALGPADARVLLVMFGLQDEDRRTITLLRTRFGRNLRVVYQPHLGYDGNEIDEVDRLLAAAHRQGKFWQMLELTGPEGERTPEAMTRAGIDPARLDRDLRDPRLEQELLRQGATLPALRRNSEGPVYFVNDRATTSEDLSTAIAQALEDAEARLARGESLAEAAGLLSSR